MKMNTISSIILGCIFMLLLTPYAFSSGSEESRTAADDVTTIRVWTKQQHTKDMLIPLVEEYNKTTGKEKGIEIEYKVHSDDYPNVMQVVIAAGETPELFENPTVSKDAYVMNDTIIPIEELPGGPAYLAQFEPYLVPQTNIIAGKTYSVPIGVTSVKLVYNKDLFKKAGIVDGSGNAKAPKTWDEVVEAARIITEQGKGQQYGYAVALKWGLAYWKWDLIVPFVSSIGHYYFDFKTGKYNFSDFKPAIEFLRSIKEDKSYFPGAEGLNADPARAEVSAGNIAMKIGASWDVGVYNDQFPMQVDLGFTDLPVLDPNNRYREYMQQSDSCVISNTARETDMGKVMEVFKWFYNDNMFAKFYEEGKFIPFKSEIRDLASKAPEKKGWAEFSNTSIGYITQNPPDGLIKLQGDNYHLVMERLWFDETMDIDEALADLDRRYNAALAEAVKTGAVDMDLFINPNFDIRLK